MKCFRLLLIGGFLLTLWTATEPENEIAESSRGNPSSRLPASSRPAPPRPELLKGNPALHSAFFRQWPGISWIESAPAPSLLRPRDSSPFSLTDGPFLHPIGPLTAFPGVSLPEEPIATSGTGGLITQAEINALKDGVGPVLAELNVQYADQVLAETLPLVGPNLRDSWQANSSSLIVFHRLHTQITTALNTFNNAAEYDPATVATAIHNRLTTYGNFPSSALTVAITTVNDQAQLTLTYARTYPGFNVAIAPDIGLPNLDVRLTGGSPQASVAATTNFSLILGVDGTGFYLDTAASNFALGTNITINSLNASGTFAGLPVNFSRSLATNLTNVIPANFQLTLKDPANDGRLRPNEAIPGTDLLDATLTGNTRTALKIDSSLDPAIMLPRAGTDLIVDWNFTAAVVDALDDNATFGNRPTLRLENNRINLNSFFNSFAGRVLAQIETSTRPLRPVTDVLTAEIPLLSDLGSGDVTILDLLGADASSVEAIGGIDALLDLAELASSFSVSASTTVDLGAWQHNIGDPRTDPLDDLIGSPTRWPNDPPTTPAALADFFDVAKNIDGLKFPLLTDANVVPALLLGRDADLFSWRTGEFGFDTTFGAFFPILGPLGVTLSGDVGLKTQLGFGYDTRGIMDYRNAASPTDNLFFNGFYAMALDEIGEPLTGITLTAGITAGIELNILVASAGIEGDITATIGIYLDDQLGDEYGRVRGDVFSTMPMSDWFYAAGSISAGLRAYLRIGWPPIGIEFDFESPRVILLNFDSRDINRPELGGYDVLEPLVLQLNVGDRAPLRIHGDLDDRAEEILIRKRTALEISDDENYEQYNLDDLLGYQPGDEILVLEGFNTLRLYPVPPLIVGHGNLRGDLLSVHEDTDVPVHFTGGEGRDILRGGSANDLLEGGEGPDLLNGRGGNNTLLGGPGDDELIAGDGANLLDGGEGEDTASWLAASIPLVMDLRTGYFGGPAANDTLISIERYKGTLHDDTMDGSEGNDVLIGLSGNDVIRGHGGDDQLEGGHGDDQLIGGDGNDYLYGGPGADHLDGGPGIDIASYLGAESPVTVSLETGLGTRGEADGDTLVSIEVLMGTGLPKGLGNPFFSGDILEGGPGDDLIYGMAGSDLIHGGAGNDVLWGNHPDIIGFIPEGFDNDTITGGTGHDILHGQGGDDTLDGEEGSDTLYGGPGDDHLTTNDLTHADYLDGGDGYDRLSADYSDKTTPLHFTVGPENSHIFPDGDQFHSMETLGILRTGSGDDVIHLAASLEPSLFHKSIYTGPGDDIVIADTRTFYAAGIRSNDHFDGGEGIDWLSFEQAISGVVVSLASGFVDGAATGITFENFENLIGTNHLDILTGDATDNIIMPLSPAFILNQNTYDRVNGGGGIDTLRIDYSDDPFVNEHGLSMDTNWRSTQQIALGPEWDVGGHQILIYYTSIESHEITGGNASDRFHGHLLSAYPDRFIGLGGNDYMDGRAGDDYLDGGEGDDVIDAGTGNDTVIGGPGNDTITFLFVDNHMSAYGHDICDAGPGDDFVSNISNPSFGSDSTAANETTIMQLDGGPGYDILLADLGHMTEPLVWDDANPIDFDLPNGGYIRGFEHLRSIILGSGNDHITLRGRHPAQRRINLRGGDDILRHSLGLVHALGGTGNDILILDYREGDEADTTGILQEGGGTQFARRRIGTNELLDRIQPNSFERIHFTGTSKNDSFTAATGSNGASGVILYGLEGNDTLTGGNSHDFLFGGPGDDSLYGGSGNDWLDGGPGADIMHGSSGNDIFIVDHPGDQVIELNTTFLGIDTVRASIDYIIPVNVENLVLTGNATQGTGNSQSNRITGNSQPNILRGEGGNDILDGGGGHKIDRLHGGSGSDTFILGSGGVRYYDDGNPATPGHGGYAIIEDFGPPSDRLQLVGFASEYLLGTSPFAEIPGSALYHDSDGNGELDPATDELIAILQSGSTLTIANTIGNAIVTTPIPPAAIGLTAPLQTHFLDHPLGGKRFAVAFEIDDAIPAGTRIEIQTSTDLGADDPWLTIATRIGNAAWTGLVTVSSEPGTTPGKTQYTIPTMQPVAETPKLFARILLSQP
jgi:Ca2+-binding RTX toxin-like protein